MERALPFYLVAPVVVRAPGAMLSTSWSSGSLAGGVFGEPIGNGQSGDEGYGAAARATWAPLGVKNRVLHLGTSAQWREPSQDNSTNTAGPKFDTVRFRAKPESNVLAQRLVDTGELADVSHFSFVGAELAAQWDSVSLQSEYQQVDVARGEPVKVLPDLVRAARVDRHRRGAAVPRGPRCVRRHPPHPQPGQRRLGRL